MNRRAIRRHLAELAEQRADFETLCLDVLQTMADTMARAVIDLSQRPEVVSMLSAVQDAAVSVDAEVQAELAACQERLDRMVEEKNALKADNREHMVAVQKRLDRLASDKAILERDHAVLREAYDALTARAEQAESDLTEARLGLRNAEAALETEKALSAKLDDDLERALAQIEELKASARVVKAVVSHRPSAAHEPLTTRVKSSSPEKLSDMARWYGDYVRANHAKGLSATEILQVLNRDLPRTFEIDEIRDMLCELGLGGR